MTYFVSNGSNYLLHSLSVSFASMFKLQREAAGSDVIRVPGGKPVVTRSQLWDSTTTLFSDRRFHPAPPDEPQGAGCL